MIYVVHFILQLSVQRNKIFSWPSIKYNSRRDGIAINNRMIAGAIVQMVSIICSIWHVTKYRVH